MSTFKGHLFHGGEMKHEARMNPRLYRAMELLSMPLRDLQKHLESEMAVNPFLELEVADVIPSLELADEGPEEREEDEIDWEEILLDGFDVGGRRQEYEHREYTPPTAVMTRDLEDHLLDQLHLLELDERAMRLGEELIGNLEDTGLLACPLDEVVEALNLWVSEAREPALANVEAIEDPEEREGERGELDRLFAPYTLGEAEALLKRIQTLDPPGIGARSIRECILLQMGREEMQETLAWTLVDEHFSDLVNHRWNEIAREIGCTPLEVQDAADELVRFDPKPGRSMAHDPERYVIPDLVVEKIDGEYMVFLNDTHLPRLRISRAYRKVARNPDQFDGENREFITRKLNAANWMIQAIEQRRQTMLRTMNCIVDRQRNFFEKGVQHLRPLTLREVADHIEMHESTVSRVTNEKYVQTPRGVYPLKFFFSTGLSTTSGEEISARGVKDKIRILIEEEGAEAPLTDRALVRRLEEEGVKIARRTVAKYRDQLGILPARMRKRVQ